MAVKQSPEPVNEITLRRLPRYLEYIEEQIEQGETYVSATQMAKELEVHHTQIRKDLAAVGVGGVPKRGHPAKESARAIRDFLGWNDTSSAFLVGAGNLGRALARYEGFKDAGFEIIAAFDNDPHTHGSRIGKIEILPMEKFCDLVRRMHVNIAVITAPAHARAEIESLIERSGVPAVWNFMPIKIRVPEGVVVVDVSLYSSLAVVTRKLHERLLKQK